MDYKVKRLQEPVSVGRGNTRSVRLWICRFKRHQKEAVTLKNDCSLLVLLFFKLINFYDGLANKIGLELIINRTCK